jgi:TonB family protein
MKSALFCAIVIGSTTVLASPEFVSTAIDVRGIQHSVTDYPKGHSPWLLDQLKAVAAEYPLAERRHHHEGSGVFRVILDTQSGAARRVIVIKSTGFKGLDDSAITSLSKWRWKPGRWRSIDYPITFIFGPPPPGLPRLPSSSNQTMQQTIVRS